MVDVYIPEQKLDENLRSQYYDYKSAGTMDVLAATAQESMYQSPLTALDRIFESKFGRGNQGRVLSAEEYANSDFARAGIKVGDDGITEGLAELLAERYDERTAFKTTLSRSKGGLGLGAAQFGVSFATQMLDPLNVASAFIPSVAVARGATIAQKAFAFPNVAARAVNSRASNRFAVGVMDGAIGAAVVEPAMLISATMDQDQDYTLMDSFLNVALGSALGGGLHWGVGKLTDRINRLHPATRDAAGRTAIGQAGSGKTVDVMPIIENAENASFKAGDAQQTVVYSADGTPSLVDVISTDAEGNIIIRDANGFEKVVNASDVMSKSPFDEDYSLSLDDSGDEVALSSLSNEQLSEIEGILDGRIEIARQREDASSLAKAESDKKAVELQQKRNAGEVVERPTDPEIPESAQAELQRLKSENEQIEQDVKKRSEEEGKLVVKSSQANQHNTNAERIAQIEAQLSRTGDAVSQSTNQLSPQQLGNMADNSQINLGEGMLEEFRDGANELDAERLDGEELNIADMEEDNRLALQALMDSEDIAELPDVAKQQLQEIEEIEKKAAAYESAVEEGKVCVIRSAGI